MAEQKANLDLYLKVLGEHLPALGVVVAGDKPTPDEVLAGLERYSKMNNEIGDDKVVFNKDAGFTEEMKTAFSASIQRMNTLLASKPMAKFGIIGMLKAGNEMPQPMKDDSNLFFAFLKDGPKIVEALSNLQKENFFKKPAPAQAPAPVTSPPVASPQVTTGPKPGAPQTTGGNPSASEHLRNVYKKDRPPITEGSPASATSTTTSQANPPSSPPAGAGAPALTPQTGGTNGGGQGVSPPQSNPQITVTTGDVKAAADMVKKALGVMAASGAIPDMPVPDGKADPDGKASVFGKQSNASLHHLLKGVKTLMRFEGKDREGKDIYGGSLDGQYSPAIGQQLIAGYGKLSSEAKAKIFSDDLKKQFAKAMEIKLENVGDGTLIVTTMVAGLDSLYENDLIDNKEGAAVENKKAEMFLKVLDFLPDSFKGQIFNFLQSSQIGQMLMQILETFTGIPLAKMLGAKTQEQGAKSDASSNIKSHIPQEMVKAYHESMAKYGNDPAKFLAGSYDDFLKKNGNDPAKLKEDMMAMAREFNEKYNKSDLLFDSKKLETIVGNALEAGKTGGGAAFSASIMSEVKGNPKPSSNGPAAAPQAAPQTPPPAPAPQEESQTPPPVTYGITPTSNVPNMRGNFSAFAPPGVPGEARVVRASYVAGAGGLDADALGRYAGVPLDTANNPSTISTAPERQPPAPQVASAPSGNINGDLTTVTIPKEEKEIKLPTIPPEKKTGHYFEDLEKLDVSNPQNIKLIEQLIGLNLNSLNPESKEALDNSVIREKMRDHNSVIVYGVKGLTRETIDNFVERNPGAGLKKDSIIIARYMPDAAGKFHLQFGIGKLSDISNDISSFGWKGGAKGLKDFIDNEKFDNKVEAFFGDIYVYDAKKNEQGGGYTVSLTPMTSFQAQNTTQRSDILEVRRVAAESQREFAVRNQLWRNEETGAQEYAYLNKRFNERAAQDGHIVYENPETQRMLRVYNENKGYVCQAPSKTSFGSYFDQIGRYFGVDDNKPKPDPVTGACPVPGMKN
ncbi:MAG TPA: hypothetical protein DEA55_06080 [Rhodospirillaceae bacterium]|nr:hypothetical protein [Rhodospirillaceae bacterium]